MNKIDQLLLKLVLIPKLLYHKYHIDTQQLEAILTARLIVDNRQVSIFQKYNNSNDSSIKLIILSFFIGLSILLTFSIGNDLTTKLTLYFSALFCFLSLIIITDFTSNLLDIRDRYIILPKPISDKTFLISRLLTIFIYLIKIVVPISLPGLIATTVISNWMIIIPFLIAIILIILLSLFTVNSVYLVILKFTTPTKFQSVITYIQILFIIIIYGIYQLLLNLTSQNNIDNFKISDLTFIQFLPTFWISDGISSIYLWQFKFVQIIRLLGGIITPILSIILVAKYLAPTFNKKILMTSSLDSRESITPSNSKRLINHVGKLITQSTEELTGFLFCWKMMLRSKEFQLKVYPTIGYLIIALAIGTYKVIDLNSIDIIDLSFFNHFYFIIGIYLSIVIGQIAIQQLLYSNNHQASWVFHTSPINKRGNFLLGGIKSVFVQFLTPYISIFLMVGFLISDFSLIMNILLSCINSLNILLLISLYTIKTFPFSVPPDKQQKGESILSNFKMVILVLLTIGIHHYLYQYLPTLSIGLLSIFFIIVLYFLQNIIKNKSFD